MLNCFQPKRAAVRRSGLIDSRHSKVVYRNHAKAVLHLWIVPVIAAYLQAASLGDTNVAALYRAIPPIQVNRTVPRVQAPKGRLEFSSNPTREEIFRARVFEEP